jgi:hypothetical protein
VTSEPTSRASGDVVQASAVTEAKEPRRDRAPRHRERGQRTSREERPRDRENRGDQSGDRHKGDGNAGARDGRGPRDKRGARDRKERRHERDRDAFTKKPAPKLYRLESIVDRGFEDMPDSADDGATRRVDWTIQKRTTAEQRTARAVSTVYVLRRDGIDTEFAHLSEARAAAHKTINHPEKLTLSKADHVASRGTKK